MKSSPLVIHRESTDFLHDIQSKIIVYTELFLLLRFDALHVTISNSVFHSSQKSKCTAQKFINFDEYIGLGANGV